MSLIVARATPRQVDVAVDTLFLTEDGGRGEFSKIAYLAQPNILFAARGDRFLMRTLHDAFFLAAQTVTFDDALEHIQEIAHAIRDHFREQGEQKPLEFVMSGYSGRERQMVAFVHMLQPSTGMVTRDRMWNRRQFWCSPWPNGQEKPAPSWNDDNDLLRVVHTQIELLRSIDGSGGGHLLIANHTQNGCHIRRTRALP